MFIKRLLDIVISATALILLSPFMLIIYLLVRIIKIYHKMRRK